jgi:tetratricopeptide (TPR) repeat protein
VHLARAHVLASRLLLDREKPDDAEAHLARAERLFGVSPTLQDAVEIAVDRSRVAVLRHDGERAVAFAREALSFDASPSDRGEALAALGDGLALLGSDDDAGAAYREAVDLLEADGRWRDAATACRAWAHMLRERGKEAEALDVLERAAELGMRATPQHVRS